jgi:hypothetical protein
LAQTPRTQSADAAISAGEPLISMWPSSALGMSRPGVALIGDDWPGRAAGLARAIGGPHRGGSVDTVASGGAATTCWLGVQPGQGDSDQPVNGCIRSEVARGCQRVQAVVGQLVGGDVVTDPAGFDGLGDQVADEVVQVMLCMRDVRPAVELGGQIGVVGVVGSLCVRVENGGQPVGRSFGVIAGVGEMRDVVVDLPFVPREQDRADVGEVLVHGGPADTGLFGDAGHRDSGEAVLGDQRGGRGDGGLPDGAAVVFDRVCPQLRHAR